MEPFSRPLPGEYNAFFQPYIDRVPEGDLLALLEAQAAETLTLIDGLDEDRALHRYAPGKWSVKEVLGHLIDTERVMAYRALCIARGDTSPLPSFDENAYVDQAHFDRQSLADLRSAYVPVRAATVVLLRGFDEAAWLRTGTASGRPISVRALAHIIAGHERHHHALLRERYGVGG